MSKPTPPDPPDPQLIEVLSRHEAACPHCGYNLRGLQSSACPECGKTVTWQGLLNRSVTISLSWVVALIGMGVSLPESFFKWQRLAIRRMLFYGEQRYIQGPGNGGYIQPDISLTNPWFVGSTLYWYLIPAGIVLLWLLRRRFERLPAWVRWTMAACLVLLAVLGQRRQMFWFYSYKTGVNPPWPFWYLR